MYPWVCICKSVQEWRMKCASLIHVNTDLCSPFDCDVTEQYVLTDVIITARFKYWIPFPTIKCLHWPASVPSLWLICKKCDLKRHAIENLIPKKFKSSQGTRNDCANWVICNSEYNSPEISYTRSGPNSRFQTVTWWRAHLKMLWVWKIIKKTVCALVTVCRTHRTIISEVFLLENYADGTWSFKLEQAALFNVPQHAAYFRIILGNSTNVCKGQRLCQYTICNMTIYRRTHNKWIRSCRQWTLQPPTQ